MYWISITSLLICAVHCDRLQELLKDLENEEIPDYGDLWKTKRPEIEKAIVADLIHGTGRNVSNVVVMNAAELKLAAGSFEKHGLVRIVFKDLVLKELPNFWVPNITILLESNIVKLDVRLTKMIIKARYTIFRNHKDKISHEKHQNAYKYSPFLFEDVHPQGDIAISVEDCILSGYVMAKLSSPFVTLGHSNLALSNCNFFAEIYQSGDKVPPVVAPLSTEKGNHAMELKHLLLKPINDEIVQKLQGSIYRHINTTELFESKQSDLRDSEQVFKKVQDNLNNMIREVNMETARTNAAIDLNYLVIIWDDLLPYHINNLPSEELLEKDTSGYLTISNLILTGLDTAYVSNTGGPYRLDSVMIGEQIKFSTLQVRGTVKYLNTYEDTSSFAVEISDFAVNVDILGGSKTNIKSEIASFRKIEFIEPWLVFESTKEIITGHLLNEIPSILINILTNGLSGNKTEFTTEDTATSDDQVSTTEEVVTSENEIENNTEDEPQLERKV